MPFQIRTPDGRVLNVSTHVGEGITVVEVWEEDAPAPQSMESSGDES